jgi:hypothetical protein
MGWGSGGKAVAWLISVCIVLIGGLHGGANVARGAGMSVVAPGDSSGLGFVASVSSLQAGGYPDAMTRFFTDSTPSSTEFDRNSGALKDVVLDLPPGVVANLQAVQKCTAEQMLPGQAPLTLCPAASQIGVVEVWIDFADDDRRPDRFAVEPLYAMQPAANQLALFGFKVSSAVAVVEASVRPSDYGVRLTAQRAPQLLPVRGVGVTVWGSPHDPVHDSQRCHFMRQDTQLCDPSVPFGDLFGNPGVRRAGFFTNPTVCDAAKVVNIQVSSWWFEPAGVLSPPVSAIQPRPTGCEKLPFDPAASVRPSNPTPDAPTGLEVKLQFPQRDNPDGVATAHLKDITVTLPEGFSLSPGVGDGLQGCSDIEFGQGSDAPVRCPDASKVGVVDAISPVLEDTVNGAIYVGAQQSMDPESGEMFRAFLAFDLPNGQAIKLLGNVFANAASGRLKAVFRSNPQFPVSKIEARFKSGPRAPLSTSPRCGDSNVESSLVSWSGQARQLMDQFVLRCPGIAGFTPEMVAGTVSSQAARTSPFHFNLQREDREDYIHGAVLSLPAGLLARLKGVPLCRREAADDGECPVPTRVGSVVASAGAGPQPLSVRGMVSLTGPYKGAPYGLSVAVPAVAGPFNLGVVVVRQALFVDPWDARVKVVSDPLPNIVGGVPIRLRAVTVDIDRPGFVLNPTSCAEKEVEAHIRSVGGAVQRLSVRFQTAGCQALRFNPNLQVRVRGKGESKVGSHPLLSANVTQSLGEASLRSIKVSLPLSIALDPDNANGLCDYEQGQRSEPDCPRSSIVGRAMATTPLLNRPLRGNVYFVKGVRRDRRTGRLIRTLPTLLLALRGEVAINVRGTTSVERGRLTSTFMAVPDAPVSRVSLRLKGGKGGILVITGARALCATRERFVRMDAHAHNGKQVQRRTRLHVKCKNAVKRGGRA